MVTTDEILRKYSRKIESQIYTEDSERDYSKEYERFKEDMVPEISRYEGWAKSLGSILSIRIAEKDRIKIQRQLDIAHLDVNASQALTLSIFSMLGVFFLTLSMSVAIFLINGSIQLLFAFLGLIASMFIFYYTFSNYICCNVYFVVFLIILCIFYSFNLTNVNVCLLFL